MSGEVTIRRILVALDDSPSSHAAVEAAAELAARFHAELLGLFVEDINLLRAVELPVAGTVGSLSPTVHKPRTADIERHLQAQAARARAGLERTARRASLRWSFQVVRGRVYAEVARAASEADLVSLGRGGWPSYRRLGSTARHLLAEGPGQVLLLPHRHRVKLPPVVVFGRTPAALRALDAGAHLAAAAGAETVAVLLPEEPEADATVLAGTARARLSELGLEASCRPLPPGDGPALERSLANLGEGVLVLPADSPLLTGEALAAFVDRLDRAVLLVR